MSNTAGQAVYTDGGRRSDVVAGGEGRGPGEASVRGAGLALIACAVGSVLLLAAHPDGGTSKVFADVLRREAAQAIPDAIVHGGFVLVLVAELIGLAALAVKAGAQKTSVIAAMLLALFGAGLLSASMILDGLITPAVAARYVSAPVEGQEAARTLFVLIGSAIHFLMPMGLGLFGASALAWGAALVPLPGARASGVIALVLGAFTLAASGMCLQASSPLPVMIALGAQAGWILTGGVLLARWRRAGAM